MTIVSHLYTITNKISGEYYIGKHNGLNQKGKNGGLYWGSGERIRNQVKKYGADNFKYEVLVIGTPEYIYELEEKIVTLNLIESDNKCLNLMGGGFGAKHTSDETKKKISLKNSGKIRSEETKQLLREIRAKQVFTKEQKDKAGKTISSLIWMNDGKKSYRVRPENVQEAKNKGCVDGRLLNYITEEYRQFFKKSTTQQWQKVKETGHTGLLIKVSF
jgi:hypothetical protein